MAVVVDGVGIERAAPDSAVCRTNQLFTAHSQRSLRHSIVF